MRDRFIRSLDAGQHLETFIVAAVAAILGIRAFLKLTGYPTLGGDALHVAHMLWGGLVMLAALVISFSFLSRASVHVAAALGGIGFGTFIDEVGKFVTHDNDYFYEPAIAIIYVVFVLTFLWVRHIQSSRAYRRVEYLLNAVRELEEVARCDLDLEERTRALEYLSRSDPQHPLTRPLTRILETAEIVPSTTPPIWDRLRRDFRMGYARISRHPRFVLAVEIFFIGQFILRLVHVAAVTWWGGTLVDVSWIGLEQHVRMISDFAFVDWARLAFVVLSGVFVAAGVVQLGRSRLAAYRQFRRSLIVTLLLAQPFIFYEEQLSASVGLAFNLLILVGLDLVIARERAAARSPHGEPAAHL